MSKPIEPFDRWHKRYPKPEHGGLPFRCDTPQQPLYPSGDHGRGRRRQARYTDYSGKEKRPAFSTWQEARDFLDKVLTEVERQTSRGSNPGSLRVEYFATEMMGRRRKRKKNASTCDTYESHLRSHILPFADHRTATSLRRPYSMAFVDYLVRLPRSQGQCGRSRRATRS